MANCTMSSWTNLMSKATWSLRGTGIIFASNHFIQTPECFCTRDGKFWRTLTCFSENCTEEKSSRLLQISPKLLHSTQIWHQRHLPLPELKKGHFYLFDSHFQNTFRIVLRFKIAGARYQKDSSIIFVDFQIILIILKIQAYLCM